MAAVSSAALTSSNGNGCDSPTNTSASSGSVADEVVTTIYVNGFPDDFKERELANMFIFAKGFEGCSLRIPHGEADPTGSPLLRCFNHVPRGQILGFVKFKTLADAQEACTQLNGRIIEADRGVTLKAELAKKNLVLSQLRSSRSTIVSLPPDTKNSIFGPSLARRSSAPGVTCLSGAPDGGLSMASPRSLSLAIPGNPVPVSVAAPAYPLAIRDQQQFILFENAKVGSSLIKQSASTNLYSGSNALGTPPQPSNLYSSMSPSYYSENPPCNTLYVGNLPPLANEIELRTLFGTMPGFRRLSFKTKVGGTPMCFVEFEDIKTATYAMEQLYGVMLSNSTKGGIRLSYSKNPLGVRSGPSISSLASSYLGSGMYNDLFTPLFDQTSRDISAFAFPSQLELNQL